ncbi:Uncharacterised protein, partial [Mesomycoplasma hyorhinis]
MPDDPFGKIVFHFFSLFCIVIVKLYFAIIEAAEACFNFSSAFLINVKGYFFKFQCLMFNFW